MSRPPVTTNVMGSVPPHELDAFIHSWVRENLHDYIMLMIAENDGWDFGFTFQTYLDRLWVEQNPDTEAGEWDIVKMPNDGPQAIRRKNFSGYITSNERYYKWIMAKEDDDE